jgi:DNA-directed RNA polymerase subunit N (RpoN/RPB10)
MKLCIVIGLLFAVETFYCAACEKSIEDQWKEFKVEFNKTYDSTKEETKRFENFEENLRKFRVHNELKNVTFRMGVNKYADETYEEIDERNKPKGR